MLVKSKKRKPTKVDSLIGQQSRIMGDIRFGGGLHVDGTIKGNVASDGDERATLELRAARALECRVENNVAILVKWAFAPPTHQPPCRSSRDVVAEIGRMGLRLRGAVAD